MVPCLILTDGVIVPITPCFRLLCTIPALLLLAGCLSALPGTPEPPAGTYRVATGTTYHWAHRNFLLHVPPNYLAYTPLPLIVVIHGAFSTGRQTESETGFSALADQERFLVAYPEGIGLFGLLQHWNAGHCCGKAADDRIDDVDFLAEVIAVVRQNLAVDPARIYMAGMSNGGMLTYRFAAERTDDLAAAAVVSGAIGSTVGDESLPWRLSQPKRALPIIGFHGLADDHVPASGGISPLKGGKRSYLSVADAIDFWRLADGCETSIATTSRNGAVNHRVWHDCLDGTSAEYFLLAGWGHQWPAPWFTDGLGADHPLRGFDATKQIWEFFRRFRRFGP
ncbi:MAG: polyhydroxybutyrate depolymerase [Deltaproteobacteria bacterium]|nr:MAG: polyhydroxybutyrate depolymerase [Deltaproteobacteria bacterium]